MEMEKKYTIRHLPENLEQYEKKEIEQGYLCVNPVVRIRKSNERYILTYKSRQGIEDPENCHVRICREEEMPLTREGYEHLRGKVDGNLIVKTRYLIPLRPEEVLPGYAGAQEVSLKIELDVFHGVLEGLVFAEVEFPDLKAADCFVMPDWFLDDVSMDNHYSNNYLAFVKDLESL